MSYTNTPFANTQNIRIHSIFSPTVLAYKACESSQSVGTAYIRVYTYMHNILEETSEFAWKSGMLRVHDLSCFCHICGVYVHRCWLLPFLRWCYYNIYPFIFCFSAFLSFSLFVVSVNFYLNSIFTMVFLCSVVAQVLTLDIAVLYIQHTSNNKNREWAVKILACTQHHHHQPPLASTFCSNTDTNKHTHSHTDTSIQHRQTVQTLIQRQKIDI